MIQLIRVTYGKKDTSKEAREYRANGQGPCGFLSDFQRAYPNEEFEIIDKISGCPECGGPKEVLKDQMMMCPDTEVCECGWSR